MDAAVVIDDARCKIIKHLATPDLLRAQQGHSLRQLPRRYLQKHLWVDLFVLDRLPDSKVGAWSAKFLQKVIYGMAIAHRDQIDFNKYSLMDKLRVGVLAGVGHLVPMPVLFKLQRLAAAKDRKKKTKHWYYSNYQPDYLYVTLEGAWCEHAVDLPFEDTKLMVPVGYEHVLEWIYGDYMTLPPVEKRVPAHSSIAIEILDDPDA